MNLNIYLLSDLHYTYLIMFCLKKYYLYMNYSKIILSNRKELSKKEHNAGVLLFVCFFAQLVCLID